MDEVTQTKTTMHRLLARWAEVEPGRCKLVENDYFKVSLDPDNWHLVYPDSLTSQDLMWIQWAVQQAIIARGWRFSLEYVNNGFWVAEIGVRTESGSDSVEALLNVYLRELEASK